jgi:hypothetical protein
LGILPPRRWNFCGSFRKSTTSGQLFLGLVDAGDVVEGDAVLVLGEQLGLGLAEAHGAARPALHLAHEEDVDANHQQDRQAIQDEAQDTGAARRLDRDVGALAFQPLHHVVLIVGGGGEIGLAGLVLHLKGIAPDDGGLDLAGVHLRQQLRIGDFALAGGSASPGHHRIETDQDDDDHAPDHEIAQVHPAEALRQECPYQPSKIGRLGVFHH